MTEKYIHVKREREQRRPFKGLALLYIVLGITVGGKEERSKKKRSNSETEGAEENRANSLQRAEAEKWAKCGETKQRNSSSWAKRGKNASWGTERCWCWWGGQTACWHFHFEPERRLMTQGRLLGASEGAAGGPQRSGGLLRRRGHFNWTLNNDMTTLQREQRGGAFSSKRPITGLVLLLMLRAENKHMASHSGHMFLGWSERMFRHKQILTRCSNHTKRVWSELKNAPLQLQVLHERLESGESCFTVGNTAATCSSAGTSEQLPPTRTDTNALQLITEQKQTR